MCENNESQSGLVRVGEKVQNFKSPYVKLNLFSTY